MNFIENAAKYSPAGSTIELTAGRESQWLVFSVADRGTGVPAEERDRIFEPFYRRQTNAPDVGGVGLGLSIARGIAEAQGGDVRLADRPGGGSVFSIRVPAINVPDLVSAPPTLGVNPKVEKG